MVVVLCELRHRGRVFRHEYDEALHPNAREIALNLGRQTRHEWGRPCWIESREQPASQATLESTAGWKLRWARREGVH
jgi:hypothetical protein